MDDIAINENIMTTCPVQQIIINKLKIFLCQNEPELLPVPSEKRRILRQLEYWKEQLPKAAMSIDIKERQPSYNGAEACCTSKRFSKSEAWA